DRLASSRPDDRVCRMKERPVMAASETARIEAFSAGVFAIAVTLLVLDLKVPKELEPGRSLASALMVQWPAYLAFVTSFLTIMVMWVNHHRMFTLIERA